MPNNCLLFKGIDTVKLDFTYDAELVNVASNSSSAQVSSSQTAAEVEALTSPSADELNQKIFSVKVKKSLLFIS